MAKVEEIYWRAECSFGGHYRHGRLMEILRCSWPEAVGIVALLFGEVRRHLPSGDLTTISDAVIQRWCHSKKVTKQALRDAGWLDGEIIGGWEERYSEIAEQRQAARDRQRAKRARDARDCHAEVTRTSRAKSDNVTSVTSLHGIAREGEGELTSSLRSDVRGVTAAAQHPPDVERLWAIYREATGRRPAPITPKAASRLAEMLGWAGSLEAAERGVRKVGASAFHRGENPERKRWDSLDDKPFRTSEAFRGWCEAPIEAGEAEIAPRETPAQRAAREHADRLFGVTSDGKPVPPLTGGAA